jgi:hypothetical protein
MAVTGHATSLEDQVEQWRSYLRRRRALHSPDIAELEDHLREQIAALMKAGLATDEAFLVAVKRIGNVHDLSREFAREHSERLWKQLVIAPPCAGDAQRWPPADTVVAFCLALAAAFLVKAPAAFGLTLDEHGGFYARNAALFVLPLLTGYFAWKRRLPTRTVARLAAAFVASAVFANVYPFAPGSNTEKLLALHLPIALWLLVGIAYAGGRWNDVAGRMDFIRFSGELFIYYVLIALGGGVLTAFVAMIFRAIGVDVEPFFGSWVLPCGAAGAVLIASWLVEAKQSVIENMAPVLTSLFAPLFAVVLVVFLGTVVWTGRGVDIERNVLIGFDLLLVVVLGLLLYSVSARDVRRPPGVADVVQVVLVVSALLADAVALWAIGVRINEFGFTPNRVAALGENAILLVNLAWSAVLYARILRSRGSFGELERWQTNYLSVYAAWAAMVVTVFPPSFGYL